MRTTYEFTDNLANFVWNHNVGPLAFVGKDGKWLRTNPALSELLGWTQIELEQMTFQDVTHPADVDADVKMVQACLAGKIDGYPMTKRYITKHGKVIWIKLRVDVVQDNDGGVMFFLSQITPTIQAGELPTSPPEPSGYRVTVADVASVLRKNWFWLVPAFSGIGYVLWLAFLQVIHQVARGGQQ